MIQNVNSAIAFFLFCCDSQQSTQNRLKVDKKVNDLNYTQSATVSIGYVTESNT